MSWSAVRTVAVLELRQRVRSTRWQVMLIVWGAVLVLLCGGMGLLAGTTGGDVEDTAPYLYDMTVCFVLAIGLIVAPTLSASSVNGDRTDATLALLQATTLRPVEIVVGKLVAAWSAALAFLAVSLPFLLALTAEGSSWTALAGHLLILVVTLGAVCAIGLGFSAATARPSASAVLTYLVVVALVAGTPLATAISSTAVRGEQQRIIYLTDYDASTNNRKVCRSEPEVQTTDVEHVERIWWMLIPNPFAALSDVAVRAPASEDLWRHPGGAILTGTGDTIDEMRNPQPSELVVNYCDDNDDNRPDSDAGPGRLVDGFRDPPSTHARTHPRPRHARGLSPPPRLPPPAARTGDIARDRRGAPHKSSRARTRRRCTRRQSPPRQERGRACPSEWRHLARRRSGPSRPRPTGRCRTP